MKRVGLIGLLLCACALPAMATTITVYTTSFLPVAHSDAPNVTLYLLDEPEAPLRTLSIGLPNSYEEATPVVLARLESERGKRLLGELKRAYQGVVNAWLNDVKALPAILIDSHYLFYGVYDVNEALAMLEAHQARVEQ